MAEQTRHLFVSGLANEVTEATLRATFIPYGELTDVHIPRRRGEGSGPRFGFVSFEDPKDAHEALLNLHNADLHGRTIRVSVSQSNKREAHGRAVWEKDEAQDEEMSATPTN